MKKGSWRKNAPDGPRDAKRGDFFDRTRAPGGGPRRLARRRAAG
jgi:hypothetical protein